QKQFDYRPVDSNWAVGAKGKWSLGEHVHHILRVEAFLRDRVMKKLIEMALNREGTLYRLRLSDFGLAPAFIPKQLLGPAEVIFDINNRVSRFFTPRKVTEQIFRYVSFPASTPEPWAPRFGRPKDELLDELAHSVDKIDSLFAENGMVNFQSMVFEHTMVGRHTLPQLTRIVSIHEEWHQDRMAEVLKSDKIRLGGKVPAEL
ncbi:MAG: DinB family protein, partial [Verrucomicrobiales bacterium]